MEHLTKIFFLICVAGLLSASGLQEASVDKLVRDLASLNQTCKSKAAINSIDDGLKEYWKCANEFGSQLGIAKDTPFNITFAKFCDKRKEALNCYKILFEKALSCDENVIALGNALFNATDEFLDFECLAHRTVLFGSMYSKEGMQRAETCLTSIASKYSPTSSKECMIIDQTEICVRGSFKEFSDENLFNTIRAEAQCGMNSGHRFGPFSNVLIAITLFVVSMQMSVSVSES